jgi:hypothetical protein
LASGDSTLPGGANFGSETMFMPHFTRGPAAVQPGRRGQSRFRAD